MAMSYVKKIVIGKYVRHYAKKYILWRMSKKTLDIFARDKNSATST